MIDKNTLLKEILENNPDLNEKKESVEKLINFLVKNNPDIKPDEDFKMNLKSRIKATILLSNESPKKIIFFTAIIQALSLAFVIGGYFYFIGGIDFFNKNDQIIIKNIPINQFENENNKENISTFGVDENINNNNLIIEDTQIVDLFGEPEQNLENQNSDFGEAIMMKSMINNFDETDSFTGDIINNLEQHISFDEFCNNSFGELIDIDGLRICIVEDKQCIQSNYINGICNFVEIK